MSISIADLPPKYQRMALEQLKAQERRQKKPPTLKELSKVAGLSFDSQGEYEFYFREVYPGLQSGAIVSCQLHKAFEIIPAATIQGKKYQAIRYTPDFFLEYATGSIVAVEIKSGFVKRMQRDYHIRRRLFLDICVAKGWTFREIFTDEGEKKA